MNMGLNRLFCGGWKKELNMFEQLGNLLANLPMKSNIAPRDHFIS